MYTDKRDEHYYDAVKLAMVTGSISIPLLQQKFNLERSRASAIIAMMLAEGVLLEDQDQLVIDPEFLASMKALFGGSIAEPHTNTHIQ